MKKFIYSIIALVGIYTTGLANVQNIAEIEDSHIVISETSNDFTVKVVHEVGSCTGNILILDRRGNVIRDIPFEAPRATSLQDCIGLYHLAVYELTLNLQQGETTGGTVDWR
ncbi:MAG: hypothetical protein ACO1N9_13550 [Flavobacterium sp.]